MAGGTEAFPELGRHCEMEDCGQLDFLPFECDGCHKVFCKEHRAYAGHDCPKADHKSRVVVVCDACSASVERRGGEDDSAALARHAGSGGCDPGRKRSKARCPARGCREQLTFSNTAPCRSCHQRLCLRHRFPDTHSCGGGRAKLLPLAFRKREEPPSPPPIRAC
ncbi:unnamed protein product [Spirodela intermedia]|uniref:AN1-type domain-containing protein n=1 Tax=Spirodela intermedia TaxID=51605 RepID=A0A7I8LAN6_SPIIN|nr:unnamed protein product [Spirodela intermedia]